MVKVVVSSERSRRRREGTARPESRTFRAAAGKLLRRFVSQRAVRPLGVIFHPPALDDNLCLQEAPENFPIQKLVAKFVVEAFDVAILPWRPAI
jgi:hypothetical protein